MKPIKIIKIIVDVLMYVLFLLLMGQHLASGALHEWLGAGLFVCFIVHNVLNYKWYKASFTHQGEYNADITGDSDGITNKDALKIQQTLLDLN